VALAGCAVTNGFNLQYHRQTCGPHQGTSMKNAFGDLIQAAPRFATRGSGCAELS
jgi:hypothetical protein